MHLGGGIQTTIIALRPNTRVMMTRDMELGHELINGIPLMGEM
jgi:hypothetical protein